MHERARLFLARSSSDWVKVGALYVRNTAFERGQLPSPMLSVTITEITKQHRTRLVEVCPLPDSGTGKSWRD
jgi:hypothetical protein